MELLTKARKVRKPELISFLQNLMEGGNSEENIAIAATIATLSAFTETLPLEPVVWSLLENILDKDNPVFLRLSRLKQIITPDSKSRYITITPEVFQSLQEEAKLLYETRTDAPDHKRAYWKSLAKGEVPYGIIVEELS